METMKHLTGASVAKYESAEVMGALGFRLTPAHGEEVMGRAFPGPRQHEAALALLQNATTTHQQLYAYAETHLLPAEVLEAAGGCQASAYTRMAGAVPRMPPILSPDFTLVLEEVGEPDFAGKDDALGWLAYDAEGRPAGLCSVSLDGVVAHLGTPGVQTDLRGTGLRRALLLSACQAAFAAGAVQLSLEAWGDTNE
jgi:hypothetical protein